jgi:FtsH-binding integral membrane protein
MATFGNFFQDFNRALEPPVRQHLSNVYACLALSTVVAGIGAYVDLVTQIASTSFLAAIVGVGLLLALTSTHDNGKNRYMRLGLLLGFSFCSGLGLGTLIDYAITINPSIIITALISTAAIFVCFSVASLTADRGRWLYLGGTLLTFLTVLIGLSFANIFFGSQLLFQAYLYLGLALMCGFVLYDTQLIIEKRRQGDKDFISHSIDLFVDLLGIFRRIVIILIQKEQTQQQSKKKRKD